MATLVFRLSIIVLVCISSVFSVGRIAYGAEQLTIDHTSANITGIPRWAIAFAKARSHIVYGGHSHGRTITRGMEYMVNFANNGGLGLDLPTDFLAYNTGGIGGALDMEARTESASRREPSSDNESWNLSWYPEWETEVRAHLTANPELRANGYAVYFWEWSYWQVAMNTTNIYTRYLDPMAQLELDYPDVTFVYVTCVLTARPQDDLDAVRTVNDEIRSYTQTNNKVLFDWADIESWSPVWEPPSVHYSDTNEEGYSPSYGGNWMSDWRDAHTQNVDWYDNASSGFHADNLVGNLMGYAAWHMFARLSGWDGASNQAIASFGDPSFSIPTDNFDEYNSEHTVYMQGTGLIPDHSYRVAFYDGSDSLVTTEDTSSNSLGQVASQHTFSTATDVSGNWNVIITEPDFDPPSSYDGSWQYTITNDGFTVQASALPEFPSAITVIFVIGACGAIYLWMRRNAVPVPVDVSSKRGSLG